MKAYQILMVDFDGARIGYTTKQKFAFSIETRDKIIEEFTQPVIFYKDELAPFKPYTHKNITGWVCWRYPMFVYSQEIDIHD